MNLRPTRNLFNLEVSGEDANLYAIKSSSSSISPDPIEGSNLKIALEEGSIQNINQLVLKQPQKQINSCINIGYQMG